MSVTTRGTNIALEGRHGSAFRQLYIDPQSVPLLGYCWWNQYYFDLVMVIGC